MESLLIMYLCFISAYGMNLLFSKMFICAKALKLSENGPLLFSSIINSCLEWKINNHIQSRLMIVNSV